VCSRELDEPHIILQHHHVCISCYRRMKKRGLAK
jgi:hypothetical protein